MPITNIIDNRERPYRFLKINVVVEAAWHDNTVEDSDKIILPLENDLMSASLTSIGRTIAGPDYEEREHISLEEAIVWASSFPSKVTLYIYDEDSGIYPREINTGSAVGQEFPNGEDEMS